MPEPTPIHIDSDELAALLPKAKELITTTPPWIYPFKGIYYLLTNTYLWPLIEARFIPCMILSTIVLLFLFTWTYLPQVAFLAIFQGHLAWVNGAFLVLGEGAVIIALLFEAFLVDETLVDIVDSVLIKEGYTNLVATRRVIIPTAPTPLSQLGKPTKSAHYSPFSLRLTIEFIIYLPFYFIPIVGAPIYFIIVGRRAGPFHHYRYLKLLGMHEKERNSYVGERKWRYTWFGAVAVALQYVPVLSMLFLLTTAAGAALWAADIEKKKKATVTVQQAVVVVVQPA